MAWTDIPLVNEELTAPLLAALLGELRPLSARLTGNQALNTSDTALQNVAPLVVTPAVNQIYRMELELYAINASGTTEDLKVGFSFPSGAGLRGGAIGGSTAGVSGITASDMNVGAVNFTSGSSTLAFGLSTSGTSIWLRGTFTMGSTPGDLQVMAAQNTSGANASSIQTGSLLTLRQVF